MRLRYVLADHVPVGAALEMRHGREHVERRRIPAGASDGSVAVGAMQVEAEVVGEHLLPEDVVEEPAIARPEQDGVVRDVLVAALRAEVPDEEPHRVAHALDARVGPFAGARRGSRR